jgi:biotin operon repressor
MELAHLLKVIADETRLRILGAISARPMTGKELADQLNLTPPTISHHMRKLTDAGIVVATSEAQRQWYRLNTEFLDATRRAPIGSHEARATAVEVADDPDARFRSRVIRDFFDGDRLKTIPSQRKRRVIILQHLLERFAVDRTYTEREVNDLLRPAHDDVATLRRELVDYGFMLRDRGIYQVTRAAPERSANVAQELVGDEASWLQALLNRAITLKQ